MGDSAEAGCGGGAIIEEPFGAPLCGGNVDILLEATCGVW